MAYTGLKAACALLLIAAFLAAVPAEAGGRHSKSALHGPLLVTATAYNSLEEQTEGSPTTAAWGDELEPGMKVVAVSGDLEELGLKRGAKVRIEGLTGHYLVLDRMPPQWQRRIDIYMGEDKGAAMNWGRRDVRIFWQAP